MIKILEALLPHIGSVFKLVELLVRQEAEHLDHNAIKAEIATINAWAKGTSKNNWDILNDALKDK